jgi:hypothetical protein
VTQATVFSVVADVAITKGETPAGDRSRLSFPDGTVRRAVVHVVRDLPHLVVESVFGLEDGVWSTLADFGDLAGLGVRTRPGYAAAKAAADAVVNRWGVGPDTADGVRDRMRGHSPEAADVADRLDDETIELAVAGVRRICREWSTLPVGGALRVTWPLRDGWLHSR